MGRLAACVLLCSIMWFSWATYLPADPGGPSVSSGRLTDFPFSKSIWNKEDFNHKYVYPCIFIFASLPTRCLSLTLLYSRSVKKASGKTRRRPYDASAVTSVMTPSSSSHLHMATFPDSQELRPLLLSLYLLCCELAWHAVHFTARATELHDRSLDSLSLSFCEPDGDRQQQWTFRRLLISTHIHSQAMHITGFKSGTLLGCLAHSMHTRAQLTGYINKTGMLWKTWTFYVSNMINGHCKMVSGHCEIRSILHISTTDLKRHNETNPLVRL